MADNITDLTGQVAVVIGGTSGLARSGAKVVPAGRREQHRPVDGGFLASSVNL